MNIEWHIREIRDKIAASVGEIDDCACAPEEKENYRRLKEAAMLLHKCADELQDALMRIHPKKR